VVVRARPACRDPCVARHRIEHRHHPAPRCSGALPGGHDQEGNEVMAATVSSSCHGRAPRSASA
jgi:hypothetical protein